MKWFVIIMATLNGGPYPMTIPTAPHVQTHAACMRVADRIVKQHYHQMFALRIRSISCRRMAIH